MPAAIRLYRLGKKNEPSYRIVVMNKRDKRQGAYIEEVGFYNPTKLPHVFDLKKDRLDWWVSRGAVISEGLQKLLKSQKKAKKT